MMSKIECFLVHSIICARPVEIKSGVVTILFCAALRSFPLIAEPSRVSVLMCTDE
jgi:hypothetical protein